VESSCLVPVPGHTALLIDRAIKFFSSQNFCVVVEFRKGGAVTKGFMRLCVGGRTHRAPNIDPAAEMGLLGVPKLMGHHLPRNFSCH
jgi:hypothetical protein